MSKARDEKRANRRAEYVAAFTPNTVWCPTCARLQAAPHTCTKPK